MRGWFALLLAFADTHQIDWKNKEIPISVTNQMVEFKKSEERALKTGNSIHPPVFFQTFCDDNNNKTIELTSIHFLYSLLLPFLHTFFRSFLALSFSLYFCICCCCRCLLVVFFVNFEFFFFYLFSSSLSPSHTHRIHCFALLCMHGLLVDDMVYF